MKTAILFGATGLIGGHCLRHLLDPKFGYDRVISFGRRAVDLENPRLVQKRIDFDRLEKHADEIRGDDLYYCMGTTLKQAGSQEAFRRIDFDYPVQIAKIAARNGVRRWLMVSSIGASADSPFFYLRTKGEGEAEIAKLPFQSVHFFRPSFLLGARSESRVLENVFNPIAQAFAPLLVGKLRRFRPIQGSEVADMMLRAAQSGEAGTQIHES